MSPELYEMQKQKRNKRPCVLALSIFVIGSLIGCTHRGTGPMNEGEGESYELTPAEEDLLIQVQLQTFQYFWEGAEPHSGLIRERYHIEEPFLDEEVVTTGGTGFGIMAILVGIERGFIERQEGVERIGKIADFLLAAPRFEGAWSHWMNGQTGEVIPFSPKDDGGDLVETGFLIQGVLCARQYLRTGTPQERLVAQKLNQLWLSVNWNFYRGEEVENVLFWHWSPTHHWEMNHRIRGYNETLITYILAAGSPSYPIPPEVYHEGWALSGDIQTQDPQEGLPLVHHGNELKGGPLFWAHYSFLGLDPRKLSDRYANYWDHNVLHSQLNYQHCIENPNNFQGYGPYCWGLTASYSLDFYAGHSPKNDLGVISPTAALSSLPYTPKESIQALTFFHEELQDSLWGPFGFYDAFSIQENWFPKKYLAIDQGPIVIMIENYRSGLLWDLFMSCKEVRAGLDRLGFSY